MHKWGRADLSDRWRAYTFTKLSTTCTTHIWPLAFWLWWSSLIRNLWVTSWRLCPSPYTVYAIITLHSWLPSDQSYMTMLKPPDETLTSTGLIVYMVSLTPAAVSRSLMVSIIPLNTINSFCYCGKIATPLTFGLNDFLDESKWRDVETTETETWQQ